jgi:hypothetical protein
MTVAANFRMRPASLLALLAFSLLMAWVLDKGQGFWQPRPPRADWAGAAWLGFPGGSEVLYLRRKIVLAHTPKRAWLAVASVDELVVHVNGKQLGHEQFIGARPSVAFDLTRILVAGPNLVAIQAKSSTDAAPAQAIALLEWQGPGPRETLRSDSTFLAESKQRASALGELPWTDLEYPDADWKRAIAIEPGARYKRTLIRPSLPLDVLARGPKGSWIWQKDRLGPTAGFERELSIDDPFVHEAWLGIASDSLYFLTVNGVSMGPVAGSSRRMGMFNIAEYLERGSNRIAIQVASKSKPVGLLVSGYVDGPRTKLDFSSDTRWRSAPSKLPAELLNEMGEEPPAIGAVQAATVRSFWVKQTGRLLRYFVFVGLLVLALGWGFTTILRGRGESSVGAWLTYAQPFAAGTLLLLLMRLIDWDQRFSLYYVYPVWLPLLCLVMIGGWLLWAALPRRSEDGATLSAREVSP